MKPRLSTGKEILIAFPSPKVRGEPSWGKVNSGEDLGKQEVGKTGKAEVYVGL